MSAYELNIDLFISTQCPHCAQALELLTKAIKQETISRLTIINLNTLNHSEQYAHIRSVPFIQVDDYEFTGEINKAELDTWIKAYQDNKFAAYYFSTLLTDGHIDQVENFLQRKPVHWLELVKLAQDPETSMQVRIGITAIFESISHDIATLAQSDAIINDLIQAAETKNHAIRVDLVYILSLLYSALKNQQQTNSQLNDFMQRALSDTSNEIQEIAEDVIT